MRSYEDAIRYLAKEEKAINTVLSAKQNNYLAGAYEISDVLGNQVHEMMGVQKEHAHMVAYIYDKPINTVYRDMSDKAYQE